MTKEKQKFIKKAEKKGYIVHKNNIRNAKPLKQCCGAIKAKYKTPVEELLSR